MTAKMWDKADNYAVCRLCSHFCRLSQENPFGKCRVRYFKNGEVFSLVDTHLAAVNIDPVEKKPFYHFKPGAKALSFGTAGCNFKCAWCQNHSLAAATESACGDSLPVSDFEKLKVLFGQVYNPEELIQFACKKNIAALAYTYNEPTVFFEQALRLAELALRHGKANLFVSNGYFSKQSFAVLKDYIQAFNIDIKAFSDTTYQTFCKASLRPVLDSCVRVRESGLHLEVTTLVIPDVNDSTDELQQLAKFIAEKLGKETVWHVSSFHPAYNMQNKSATPVQTLEKAFAIGKDAGLEYIYFGNVPKENDTLCPNCHAVLVKRNGYFVDMPDGFSGKCPHCEYEINGIWE